MLQHLVDAQAQVPLNVEAVRGGRGIVVRQAVAQCKQGGKLARIGPALKHRAGHEFERVPPQGAAEPPRLHRVPHQGHRVQALAADDAVAHPPGHLAVAQGAAIPVRQNFFLEQAHIALRYQERTFLSVQVAYFQLQGPQEIPALHGQGSGQKFPCLVAHDPLVGLDAHELPLQGAFQCKGISVMRVPAFRGPVRAREMQRTGHADFVRRAQETGFHARHAFAQSRLMSLSQHSFFREFCHDYSGFIPRAVVSLA